MQVAENVFRCNHGSSPSALNSKDKLRRNNHEAGQEVLKRAICRIVLLRCPESCLFQTRAPLMWNTLPRAMQQVSSRTSFKKL